MERIDFVLWMVLFFPSCDLSDYISALTKEKYGRELEVYSDKTYTNYAFFKLIVWVVIGILLW